MSGDDPGSDLLESPGDLRRLNSSRCDDAQLGYLSGNLGIGDNLAVHARCDDPDARDWKTEMV